MVLSMESGIRMRILWSSTQAGTSLFANCSFSWNARDTLSTLSWSFSSTKMSKSRRWWQCASLKGKPKTYTKISLSSCWRTSRSTPPYQSRWINSSTWIQTPFLSRMCCPSSYTVVQTEPFLLAFWKKATLCHTVLHPYKHLDKKKTLDQDRNHRVLNSMLLLLSLGKIPLRG